MYITYTVYCTLYSICFTDALSNDVFYKPAKSVS